MTQLCHVTMEGGSLTGANGFTVMGGTNAASAVLNTTNPIHDTYDFSIPNVSLCHGNVTGLDAATMRGYVYVKFRTSPAQNIRFIRLVRLGATVAGISIRTDRKLEAYRGTSFKAVGTTVLAVNTVYRVGFEYIKTVGAVNGQFNVWIAEGDAAFGSTEMAATDALYSSNVQELNIGSTVSAPLDMQIDHLIVNDDVMPDPYGTALPEPGTTTIEQWTDSVAVISHTYTGGDDSEVASIEISTNGIDFDPATEVYSVYDRVSDPKVFTAYIGNLYTAAGANTGTAYTVRVNIDGAISDTETFTTLPRQQLKGQSYDVNRVTPTNYWYSPPASASSDNTVEEIASANMIVFTRDGADQPYIEDIKEIHPDGRNFRVLQYVLFNEIEADASNNAEVPSLRNTLIGRDWTGSSDGADALHASATAIAAHINAQETWFMHKATGYDGGNGTITKANRVVATDGTKIIMNPGAAGWVEYQKLLFFRHALDRHSFGPSGYATTVGSSTDLRRFIGFFGDNVDPDPRPSGLNSVEYGADNDTNNGNYRDDVIAQVTAIKSALGIYLMGNVLHAATGSGTSHVKAVQFRELAAVLDGVMAERWSKNWSASAESYITPAEWKTDMDNTLLTLALPNAPDYMAIAQVYDPSKDATFANGQLDTVGFGFGHSSFKLIQPVDDNQMTYRAKMGAGTGSARYRIYTEADFDTLSWDFDPGVPAESMRFLAGQTAVGGGSVTSPDGIWARTYNLPDDAGTITYYLNVSSNSRVSNVSGIGTMPTHASAQQVVLEAIDQFITVSSIAAGLAFGSPTFVLGDPPDQFLIPGGITTQELFGDAIITRLPGPMQTITVEGINTAEIFGNLGVTQGPGPLQTIIPGSISTEEMFGDFTLTLEPGANIFFAPDSILSEETFGQTVITVGPGPDQIITVTGIASGEVIGTLRIRSRSRGKKGRAKIKTGTSI